MRIRINVNSDFLLSAVAESHGWIRLAPFSYCDESGIVKYVVRLSAGKIVKLTVMQESEYLIIDTDSRVEKQHLSEIEDKINWMFRIEEDLSEFYDTIKAEPRLNHLQSAKRGRLLRCSTFFEDVVKTIMTTNTAWSGTVRMVENLSAFFASESPSPFPSPEEIVCSSVQELRNEVKLGYRAQYIFDLAQNVSRGSIDIELHLNSDLPSLELHKKLQQIKGVGNYAASSLLMLLGRYDFIPIDSWAFSCVSKEWYDSQPVGKKEVEARFEKWSKWKGLAYWFWDWEHRK